MATGSTLEMDKLDRWAEDRRASLKAELGRAGRGAQGSQEGRSAGADPAGEAGAQRQSRTLKPSATRPGGPTIRPAATSTGRRTRLLDEISRRLEQTIAADTTV